MMLCDERPRKQRRPGLGFKVFRLSFFFGVEGLGLLGLAFLGFGVGTRRLLVGGLRLWVGDEVVAFQVCMCVRGSRPWVVSVGFEFRGWF